MTDERRYPQGNTRQIMDFNRFLSLTGDKVFLCLDAGIIQVCKYLLNSRGSWRTSYAVEWLDHSYIMPTEEQFLLLTQAIAEANTDMASCSDIVEAIQGISTAITNQGGSSGCGCIGEGGQDVTDVNDTPTSEIPPSDEWEEAGFSSQEAYNDHRCNVAQEILQNYIGTLRNWAGLFGMVGGLTLAVVAGLLLLTVPPAGLMLIVSALGIVVGADIGLLVNLSNVADDLEGDIDTLRCGLYNAGSTGDAAQVIRDAAQAAVEALSLGVLESTFLAITDNLISNDAVANLFNPDYVPSVTDADCSACGDEGYLWAFDTDEEGWIWSETGVNPTPGEWGNALGEGSLQMRIAPNDGNPVTQTWTLLSIPFVVQGTEIAIDMDNNGVPITMNLLVTYTDTTTDGDSFSVVASPVEYTMALDGSKVVDDIEIEFAFDPSGITTYDFTIAIEAVEVR